MDSAALHSQSGNHRRDSGKEENEREIKGTGLSFHNNVNVEYEMTGRVFRMICHFVLLY